LSRTGFSKSLKVTANCKLKTDQCTSYKQHFITSCNYPPHVSPTRLQNMIKNSRDRRVTPGAQHTLFLHPPAQPMFVPTNHVIRSQATRFEVSTASWHWIEPSPTRYTGHSIEIERPRPSQLDRSISDTRLKATWDATTNTDFVSPWGRGMEIILGYTLCHRSPEIPEYWLDDGIRWKGGLGNCNIIWSLRAEE
jgi:hypothetical protein